MNKKTAYTTALLLVVSFALSWLLFLLVPGIFQTWKLQTSDFLFRQRYRLFGNQSMNPSIVHLDLDDKTASSLDPSMRDNRLYSRLIYILSDVFVGAVAFDMVFAEPDRSSPNQAVKLWTLPPEVAELRNSIAALPSHDAKFAQSIANARVITGFVLTSTEGGRLPAEKR